MDTLAGLARRRAPRESSRHRAVRQAEIRRPALALRETNRAVRVNRLQLRALVDELAPGDRAFNRAVHTIALTRMRSCPDTQTYVARRTAEGKTARQIRRCLKRYIARQLSTVLSQRR